MISPIFYAILTTPRNPTSPHTRRPDASHTRRSDVTHFRRFYCRLAARPEQALLNTSVQYLHVRLTKLMTSLTSVQPSIFIKYNSHLRPYRALVMALCMYQSLYLKDSMQ